MFVVVVNDIFVDDQGVHATPVVLGVFSDMDKVNALIEEEKTYAKGEARVYNIEIYEAELDNIPDYANATKFPSWVKTEVIDGR